ncbi:MAG: alpha/beta hydrolase [Polyangiaceae bacterium]|nr:alpha/beta hydrolase [Polyangiaceae bacterium]
MSFQLAHFAIGEGANVALLLHGALGSGQNFRSLAKRLQRAYPSWKFVCADLRHHGASHPAPGPNTLASCTNDLQRLAGLAGDPQVVIGHSFGGKVALDFAASRPEGLRQVWVLDSDPGVISPGPRGSAVGEVEAVMEGVRKVPQPIAKRDDVVSHLTEQGFSMMLSRWMTTNLRRVGSAYEWTFDLDSIGELLVDYRARDLWEFLEDCSKSTDVHIVVADRSDRISPHTRARAESLPAASRVSTHRLENSGHWVHVDNPDGLMNFFGQHWPASE